MRRSRVVTLSLVAMVPLLLASYGGLAGPSHGGAHAADPHEHPATALNTHWMHVQDINNRFPMNTQSVSHQERDVNAGQSTPSIVTDTDTDLDIHFANNWFYAFNTPGFVEINDGEWRTHNEPGLAADVHLAGDPELVVYVSAYPVPGGSSSTSVFGQSLPGAVPQLGLYARWETGRFPGQGDVIAEGDTSSGPLGTTNIITLPGGQQVQEMRVRLAREMTTIPGDRAGTILSFNLYQVKAKDGPLEGAGVTQADWRLHSGPQYAPRLLVRENDPMRTVSAGLRLDGKTLHADWSILSPWGSYDVDDRSFAATLTGPDGVRIPRLVSLQRSVDHDGHFRPVEATWAIDGSTLSNGHYTLALSASNLQGSHTQRQSFEFDVQGGIRLP